MSARWNLAGDPLFTLGRDGEVRVETTAGVKATVTLDEAAALSAARTFYGGGGTMNGAAEEVLLAHLGKQFEAGEVRQLFAALKAKGLIRAAEMTAEARKKAPIFMIFSPRSGSNMLRWLVDTHPNISCPPPSVALQLLLGVSNHVYSGAAFRALRSPRDWTRATLRAWASEQMEKAAQKANKPRWCHRIWTTYAVLPWIDELFGGDATYLFLVRHALDVVDAASKVYVPAETWQAGPNGIHQDLFAEHGGSYPLGYAHLWREISEKMLEFRALHPSRVFVLKYEDLVSDPSASLGKMFGFFGEALPDGLVEKAFKQPPRMLPGWQGHEVTRTKKIESEFVGMYRAWDPDVVRACGPIVNDTLRAWGYDPVSS